MEKQTSLQTVGQDSSVADATDTIVVYAKGKTWDCPECGFGIGTKKEDRYTKCYKCGAVLLDDKAEQRDKPTKGNETRQATLGEAEEDEDQSALGDFINV